MFSCVWAGGQAHCGTRETQLRTAGAVREGLVQRCCCFAAVPGGVAWGPALPTTFPSFGQVEAQQALQPTALGRWGQRWPGLFCSLGLGLALLFILSRPLVSEPCPACLGWFAVGLQGLMEPQKPDLFTGSPQAGPKGPLTERERGYFSCP